MKVLKLFLLFPFIVSCNITSFDKPMPVDGTTLSAFPKTMIGTYYYAERMFDSSTYNEKYFPDIYKKKESASVSTVTVYIKENTVAYQEIEKQYYDTTKIDLTKISLPSENKKATRESIDNYVLFKSTKEEVVVNMTKDVLVERNGIYYVNIKDDDDDWMTIQLIKSKKGKLTISMLSSDKIKSLPDDFTVKTKESGFGSIIYDVTAAQFNYLLKENYFEELFSLKKE